VSVKPLLICLTVGAALGFVGGGVFAAWAHVLNPLDPALAGEPVCVVGWWACCGAAAGLGAGALLGALFTLVAAVVTAVGRAGRRGGRPR
jgi:hypothetical protein